MLNCVDGSTIKVGQLVVVIYGHPNIGKTSLAMTARKAILLDFDKGSYRAGNKTGVQVVPVGGWSDVANITKGDLKPFHTVVIDTVGSCLDHLMSFILSSNMKGVSNGAGGLSLGGYGVLKNMFKNWLDMLKSHGLDVVLIAHMSEETRGDDLIERIVATGGSRQEVYMQADLMGRLGFIGKDRVLTFNPTQTSFGKNVGLDDYKILSPEQNPNILDQIIETAKGLLNKASETTMNEHDRFIAMRKTFEAIAQNGLADLNATVKESIELNSSATERKILVEVGIAAGYVFNKDTKMFENKPDEESAKDKFLANRHQIATKDSNENEVSPDYF